ncbi:MAG TPA: ATP-binding protein, partial [Hydrogenophaga sp.]
NQWMQAEPTGHAIRLRSDVERKRLHGLSALAPSGSGLNAGIYTQQAHEETYASLLTRTRMLLNDGWSVIVDAAFLRQGERQAFASLARSVGSEFRIIACEAPETLLRERIDQRRTTGTDASEATASVLAQQMEWIEPLTEQERASASPPEALSLEH